MVSFAEPRTCLEPPSRRSSLETVTPEAEKLMGPTLPPARETSRSAWASVCFWLAALASAVLPVREPTTDWTPATAEST